MKYYCVRTIPAELPVPGRSRQKKSETELGVIGIIKTSVIQHSAMNKETRYRYNPAHTTVGTPDEPESRLTSPKVPAANTCYSYFVREKEGMLQTENKYM